MGNFQPWCIMKDIGKIKYQKHIEKDSIEDIGTLRKNHYIIRKFRLSLTEKA